MASGRKNYFRHSFQASKDPKIVDLISTHGKQAYFHFFRLLELCGEQAAEGPQDRFIFHRRTLCAELMVTNSKLGHHLLAMQSSLLLHVVLSDRKVEVLIPKLAKYMGKYESKKPPNSPNKRKENKRKENKEQKEKNEPIEVAEPGEDAKQNKSKSDQEKLDYIAEHYNFLPEEVRTWMAKCSLKVLIEFIETYDPGDMAQAINDAYDWNFEKPKSQQKKTIGMFLKNWFRNAKLDPVQKEKPKSKLELYLLEEHRKLKEVANDN